MKSSKMLEMIRKVIYPAGEKKPLTIKNDIEVCVIMSVFMHDEAPDENHIVIEVK